MTKSAIIISLKGKKADNYFREYSENNVNTSHPLCNTTCGNNVCCNNGHCLEYEYVITYLIYITGKRFALHNVDAGILNTGAWE